MSDRYPVGKTETNNLQQEKFLEKSLYYWQVWFLPGPNYYNTLLLKFLKLSAFICNIMLNKILRNIWFIRKECLIIFSNFWESWAPLYSLRNWYFFKQFTLWKWILSRLLNAHLIMWWLTETFFLFSSYTMLEIENLTLLKTLTWS